ncbi:MAG: nickel pincer cofactor biosynthesis protein LarC [Mitsuokella sp.]
MKAIYLDCFSGVSGNMLLGAFLQAGVPESYLRDELHKLPMAGEYVLHVDAVQKAGIHACYADVRLSAGGHGHAHRTMRSIRTRIEDSTLSEAVKQKSIAVFEHLAKAEGKVHGTRADEVAFHEIGAVDSLVDIVGAAICLDYLDIERIFVSKINTGSGFVPCGHGTMPVPAPATAELLIGWETYQKGDHELTTPTGAAILRTLAEQEESLPKGFLTERIAYGAGTWDLDVPNVVRLFLGTYEGERKRAFCVLETNIDDMNPQIYGYLYERLLEAGAQDVWTTSIYMKKSRPAVKLSVLCDDAHRDTCVGIVFSETTTAGIRVLPLEARLEASRRMAVAETRYGAVSCKVCAWDGHISNVSVEYEDCRRLAEENGVPLKIVQREAMKEICTRLGE